MKSKSKRIPGLVSVVVPTYNQKSFISETLNSVIEQSYKNIEIIIADDCSTDGTLEIIQMYADKDSRIKLLPSDKNLGIPENFNRAFDAVTGEFVAFLGGDDIMFPEKIEQLVNFIKGHPEAGLVYSDMEVYDSISDKLLYLKSEKGIYNQPLDWVLKIDWYLEKNNTGIIPSACLARSSYYLQARYNSRFYLKHEVFFTLEDYYLNPGMKWIYLDKVLGRYRFHEENFSTSKKAHKSIVEETFLVADLALEKYPAAQSRITDHLKYFTFKNILNNSKAFDEYPRFIEIYNTFNFKEKLHFHLSRVSIKVGFFDVYIGIARIFRFI